MHTLLIDNNDSFTYNIAELLKKNRMITYEVVSISSLDTDSIVNFEKVIFSPGHGKPDDFPKIKQILEKCKRSNSILGICLGHQAICEYFGSKLIALDTPCHGQEHIVNLLDSNNCLYRDLPNKISVGLYHSWTIDTESLPDCLRVTGMSERGILMSVSHKEYDIHGVQFHPESFLTEHGPMIINNFLSK